MPWSMALRTRWVRGSPMRSTTVLSSSVSAPSTCKTMSLPSSLETSRTTRWKRLNVPPICTIRRVRAQSRTSSTRRESELVASISSPIPLWMAPRLAPAPAMISSPTRLIN
ncbi:hypothetical protein D9M68_955490 [compost metagenome]